jgi:hypothetical protein
MKATKRKTFKNKNKIIQMSHANKKSAFENATNEFNAGVFRQTVSQSGRDFTDAACARSFFPMRERAQNLAHSIFHRVLFNFSA